MRVPILQLPLSDHTDVHALYVAARDAARLSGMGAAEQSAVAAAVAATALTADAGGGDGRAELYLEHSGEDRHLRIAVAGTVASEAAGTGAAELFEPEQAALLVRRAAEVAAVEHAAEPGSASTFGWSATVDAAALAAVVGPASQSDGDDGDIGSGARAAALTAALRAELSLARSEQRLREAEAKVEQLTAELHETNHGFLALHAELEQATRAADAANQAKSQFVSRMSHELRTPLNAVLGFAQLLEHDDLDPSQRESVSHILTAGRHLLDLISEVLDIARIEAGRLPLSPEAVQVEELAGEVAELLRPLADARGIRLEFVAGAGSEHYLYADRQRVRQILMNLLSNAIKYNRPRGTVELSCHQDGDDVVRISVIDSGYGMTAEQLEAAFEPFERLGADATQIEGSGVGLPLAQRLAEAMGGGIEASSEPGSGSVFHVLLPAAERPGFASDVILGDATTGRDEAPSKSRSATILYVEDNRINQQLVERILRLRPDLGLILASKGRDGFELARREQPDLILLDMHLPDESGDETLARLRAEETTADIPVVMLSGDASPGQIRRLLAAGARAYVTKPLDVTAFLETIDAALARDQ
jgi:signal transduction histidine kinase/ActR/RegA family two-component response regulator